MTPISKNVMESANKKYDEFMRETGGKDFVEKRTVFIAGYVAGIKSGLEFGEFISRSPIIKKNVKGGKNERRK